MRLWALFDPVAGRPWVAYREKPHVNIQMGSYSKDGTGQRIWFVFDPLDQYNPAIACPDELAARRLAATNGWDVVCLGRDLLDGLLGGYK